MILEKPLNGLDNQPIKTTKKPPSRSINPNLPPCYFTSIFIGSKGSGKTYSLIKLLKNYEKYPLYDNDNNKLDMRVIVFCPTILSAANPIYETLKYLDHDDIILDYSDDKLLDKLDDIEAEKQEIEDYNEYLKVWKKFIKINENVNLLTPDELVILNKYEFTEPELIKDKPKYKHPRINFLVFDDLVGDANAFKRGHSAINNLTIRHRHLQCNLLFTTQYIKAIPPVLRRNLDIFVLFKFANAKSVVEQIYPEISAYINEDDFIQLFEYATEKPNDSLIIDNTQKLENKFKKNWNISLSFNNKSESQSEVTSLTVPR
jgi:hypothetical protein